MGEIGGGVHRTVPAVGVAGDEAQELALAAAADRDRRPRLLERFRVVRRVVERVVLALERRPRLGEEAADHLEALLELLDPHPNGRKVVPVAAVLLVHPSGADAELEPAFGDLIQARRHLRHRE